MDFLRKLYRWGLTTLAFALVLGVFVLLLIAADIQDKAPCHVTTLSAGAYRFNCTGEKFARALAEFELKHSSVSVVALPEGGDGYIVVAH